jgi:hypothetical protein
MLTQVGGIMFARGAQELHTPGLADDASRVKPPRRSSKTDPVLDRLERAGRIRPATADLRDVLARRGPPTGPVTDAGTRALQEQRGDRG